MTRELVPQTLASSSASASGSSSTSAFSASSSSSSSAASSSATSLHASSRRLLRKRARGLTSRTTCIHPQLRDLLVVSPANPGQVIAAAYQHLALYTVPKRRDSLQQLSFIPNVLVQGCGVLACGGQHAELSLRSADTKSNWSIHTKVGKSINNSAHLSPSPSQPLSTPRVHVCNNDHGIYRYDLHFPKRWGTLEVTQGWGEGEEEPAGQPELDFVDRIGMNTPVNHTSVSPDGRSMIAVGDTNEVFVFAISPSGHVSLIDTIEATDDASFSTSWSRSGESFAIASQDGTVTIYDRRHLKPIKQFHTFQRGALGAARVVKYSQGPHELLAFTEQKNYIHIVDARTYEYSETIYIPDVELEEIGRSTLSSSINAASVNANISDGIRHSLLRNEVGVTDDGLSGTRGASYSFLRGLRDNPWDTMPTDDAYQTLLNLSDCPPPSLSAYHDDTLLASLPSPSRRPWLATGRRSPNMHISTTPTTVGAVLGNMMDFPSSSSTSSSTGADTRGHLAGNTAITGLDWDPSGEYLYACTERIILEWRVDSASRRSHPAATVL